MFAVSFMVTSICCRNNTVPVQTLLSTPRKKVLPSNYLPGNNNSPSNYLPVNEYSLQEISTPLEIVGVWYFHV